MGKVIDNTVILLVDVKDNPYKLKSLINKKYKVIMTFTDHYHESYAIYEGFKYTGINEIKRRFTMEK